MKPVKIDYDLLALRCKMQQEEFQDPAYGECVKLVREGYESYTSTYDQKTKVTTRIPRIVPDEETFYMFKDNGAKVLAVAHLDTVLSTQDNWTFERAKLGSNRNKRSMIFNAQLDDRLGVHILLDMLPLYLGDNAYDILLTTDEETSQSTAADFIPPEGKKYNWIFQFDRRGTGAVLYDYEDAAWRTTVSEFLRVDVGTFSDICKLYSLGVKGLNVGTGYHDEHQDLCYMVEEEVEAQVTRFISFFRRNKDTEFPHVETPFRKKAWGWNDDDWGDYNYRTGGYWDGTKWVTSTSTDSGSTNPNGLNRYPVINQASGSVTGAPKHSGLQRLFAQPSLDPDDETNVDNDYGDGFDDRDFLDGNELKMLASVSGSMSNYDSDSKTVSDDLFIRASAYDGEAWDWIELPAVYKENCLLRYANEPSETPSTLIPIYHNRVNGRKACYCKVCSLARDLDDMYWTRDSVPVCIDCVSILPAGTQIETTMPVCISDVVDEAWEVPLTDEQIRWLAEGGGIRMSSSHNSRSYVGVDEKVERCYCNMCGEPEWPDKVLQFSNPLFTKGTETVEVCRDCFVKYQSEEGI